MSMPLEIIGAVDDRTTPSPVIWHRFNKADGEQRGILRWFHDDFNDLATSGVNWLRDESDDNADITLIADEETGFVRLQVDSDDNEEAWMTALPTGGTLVNINANNGNVGYETRFRVSNVSDNGGAIALGLIEDGLSAGDNVIQDEDSGDIAQLSIVGAQTLHADGNSLDIVHGVNGSEVTQLVDGAQTLVADTWYKFGFYFNQSSGEVQFFIDEVLQSTTVLEGATNFPDDVGLVPFFAVKTGSAATQNYDIDWVRCAQYLP